MAFSMSWHENENEDEADRGMAWLAGLRGELYCSLGMRRDALFRACDALACRPERLDMLAELCLEPEFRRGHGGVYDALNSGEVVIGRLRRPARSGCSATAARGKGNAQMIPGWPYCWIVALEPGRTSWTLPLDAVRPGPADDATEVTAARVRDVTARLITAGHWHEGDPDVIVVPGSGYDLTRLHQQLARRAAWEHHQGDLFLAALLIFAAARTRDPICTPELPIAYTAGDLRCNGRMLSTVLWEPGGRRDRHHGRAR